MLLLLLNNWRAVLFGTIVLVLGTAAGYYKWQANRWEAKYETFRVETTAAGLAAEIRAKETKARDEKAKEVADANYRKSLNSLRADNQRLRDEHAASSIVPPAAPGSRDPSTACFDRPQLVGALRRFEAGIEAIAGEGDEARQALDSAKAWAQTPH